MRQVGRLELINRASGGVLKTPVAEGVVTGLRSDGDQQQDLSQQGYWTPI
jgi:hypothetical protein